jgi:hypothetical protein
MRLLAMLLALLLAGADVAVAQVATTTVQDTIYSANGTPASGTVLLSWSAFTTAGGVSVPAGTTSVTIGANGVLTVALAPNAGATPMGSYYTAVLHLSDGTTGRQYWVVPVTVPGGGPAKLAAIQNTVLPTTVAMQTVSKQYVDNAIAAALTGYVAPSSSPFLLKAGDTMTGPLVLPADAVSPLQAADKNYVDESVAAVAVPFGPSGAGHAKGLVPDPGATAGATRFLREDGGWAVPAGGGSGGGGTMAAQNANAVAITGGSIDGTVIGGTTPAAGHFTTLSVSSPTVAVPTVTSRNAFNTVYQNTTGYNALENVSVSVPQYSNPLVGFNIGSTSGTVTTVVVPLGFLSDTVGPSNGVQSGEAFNFTFMVPAGWYVEALHPNSDGVSMTGWAETTLP